VQWALGPSADKQPPLRSEKCPVGRGGVKEKRTNSKVRGRPGASRSMNRKKNTPFGYRYFNPAHRGGGGGNNAHEQGGRTDNF